MQLLEDLEAAMFSNQVKVRAPIELAPSGNTMHDCVCCDITNSYLHNDGNALYMYLGRAMLEMYFDIRRHKLWKMMRYTKLRIY